MHRSYGDNRPGRDDRVLSLLLLNKMYSIFPYYFFFFVVAYVCDSNYAVSEASTHLILSVVLIIRVMAGVAVF